MSISQQIERKGSPRSADEPKHDLTFELGRRLVYLAEYDRYVANARGRPELQAFWRSVRSSEQRLVDQLERLIAAHSLKVVWPMITEGNGREQDDE